MPLEKPSVDDRTAMCLKSMVSVNEEKELSLLGGYFHGCLRR